MFTQSFSPAGLIGFRAIYCFVYCLYTSSLHMQLTLHYSPSAQILLKVL